MLRQWCCTGCLRSVGTKRPDTALGKQELRHKPSKVYDEYKSQFLFPNVVSFLFVSTELITHAARDPATTPFKLYPFDAHGISEHSLAIGKICWRYHWHASSQTAHQLAKLRYCVDRNMKLTNQSSVGMHDNLVEHVWGRLWIKVGAWIQQQRARIHISFPALDLLDHSLKSLSGALHIEEDNFSESSAPNYIKPREAGFRNRFFFFLWLQICFENVTFPRVFGDIFGCWTPSKKRCFSTQEFTSFLSTVSSQRWATRSDVSFQTK